MTPFWVGMRIFLMPTLILVGILWVKDEVGGGASTGHTGAAIGANMIKAPMSMLEGLGGLAGGGGACNTLGFGCGGSITAGAKRVHP